ncbi:uncharacterized protein ACNS7B_000291 isoform 3-T3 [Menidia menidia]
MRAALFLLAICGPVCRGRAEASAPSPRELPLLWDELRGLREMVLELKAEGVERRQALRGVESRLRDREQEVEQHARSLERLRAAAGSCQSEETRRNLLEELRSGLISRMEKLEKQGKVCAAEVAELRSKANSSESSMEELERKNAALAAELPFLQTRLRASESTIDQLKRNNAVLTAKLCHTETLMEDLRGQISEFPTSNSSTTVIPEVSALEGRLNVQLEKLQANANAQTDVVNQLQDRLSAAGHQLLEVQMETTAHLSSMESRLTDKLNSTAADMEVRLRSTETQLEQLGTDTAAMELRLGEKEKLLEDLKTGNSELESRLLVSEKQLGDLKSENSDMEVRLRSTETHLEQLGTDTSAMEVRLGEKEKLLDDLKTENSELESRLVVSEKLLGDLKSENSALEVRQRVTEKLLENLKTGHSAQTDVVNQLQDRLSAAGHQLLEVQMETTAHLSSMESRLTDKLNSTAADMEVRLRSTETHLEQLGTDTAAMEVRLGEKEKLLEDLKTENSELESRLVASEKQLGDLKSENSDMEVRLRSTETQLEQLGTETAAMEVRLGEKEKLLEDLKTENSELESRLVVSEKQLGDLKSENSVCEAQLSAVTVRLNVTEEQLDRLKTQITVRAVELVSISDTLRGAQRKTEELQVRLRVAEAAVNELKMKNRDPLKVGFSAGLTDAGPVGPFDEESTLIFSKTITNIGQGYNQSAGVFTAPTRGVYFFSFTVADYLKGYMGLYLYRNNQPVVFNLDLNDHGGYASTSNALALQLEEGDQIRLSLPASYRLYDDSRNFSVFSGFLLFPV